MNIRLGMLSILAIAVIASSCSRAPRVNLYNNTPFNIVIQCAGMKCSVAQGASRIFTLPDIPTQLIIISDSTRFTYLFTYPPIEYCHPTAKSVINVQLESDGRLYVFLPNTILPVENTSDQPEGFPLTPDKEQNKVEQYTTADGDE